MGYVDFHDDERRRFVVNRYAYDAARRERRHIVLAVVDNEREFDRLINEFADDLRARRASGESVDPREHISGHVMEPGYLARAANGHVLRGALKHGVLPERLQQLDLPSNMSVLRADRDGRSAAARALRLRTDLVDLG